jgi:hypothetical protein
VERLHRCLKLGRVAGSKRFFLKKEAKTFIHWLRAVPREREAKRIEVFWFFFSKKNRLPCLAHDQCHSGRPA